MDIDAQDAVCAFVRDIISARTNEKIEISARPDRDERNFQAVEELWESPTRRYAIEHTRVEAFEGQIANQVRIIRLLVPVKTVLADRLPGYFGLAVREADMSSAQFDVKAARPEVARLVLEAAGSVPVGEVVTLKSDELPFTLQLYLRHRDSRNRILYTDIEGDPEARRLERIRRALDAKCPKLRKWTADNGRTSVLALESNDIHSAFAVSEARKLGAGQRPCHLERWPSSAIAVLRHGGQMPWVNSTSA